MECQASFILICFSTAVKDTCEQVFLVFLFVGVYVHLKIASTLKPFVTIVTLERPFTCVASDVSIQVALLSESHPTLVVVSASEWFVIVMDPLVFFKCRQLLKGF